MADNKQPFDDEFDTDEFDAFNEDFNFDDDDESSFQFDDIDEDDATTAVVSEAEDAPSEYEYSGDDAFSELQDMDAGEQPSTTGGLSGLINRLKNEEPKQLVKYGIGAGIAILLIIGGLVKFILPSNQPTNASPAQTSSITAQPASLNQAPNNTPNNTPVVNNNFPANTVAPQAVPNPNEGGSFANMTPTSVVPAPETPVTLPAQTMQQNIPTVVNNTQMQQAESQSTDLTQHFAQLDKQVGQLTQQLAANSDMNASNQAQIASLIKSIDNMQTQMAKLNNALQTIVNATSQHNSGQNTGSMNNDGNTNSASGSNYYVQAIIPGRAWLKNSNGQIITVAPGDSVPGYGTVSNIDAQNGVVITSTGTKIVFGIDEG